MNTVIRKFELFDAEGISRLLVQWGHPVSLRKTVDTLKRMEASANEALFVAEINPAVVGWIHVAEKPGFDEKRSAEIFGLIVDEDFREQGIGKELIEAAKYWAKQQGYERLVLRTNTLRIEANRFYPAIGFQLHKQQHVFVTEL